MPEEISVDESWETETGLLDSYDGTIQRSWFATDARYNDGQTIMLHWEIATNSPEIPEVTEKFPCGTGWDSRDGGKSVVHDGGKQRFNKSSIYGKIIARVQDDTGVLHDAFPAVKSRGRAQHANVWEGLTFHFEREEFDYGGEIGKRSRVMPVKFLGTNAQPSMTPVTAAAPAAAAAPSPSTNGSTTDPLVIAKLRAAAQKAADHQSFLDAAMEIEGVVTDNALLATLVDDSASGFYATAKG